jgi:hypothetical protein
MADAQMQAGDAAPAGEFSGFTIQHYSRSLAALTDDLDLTPSDIPVPSCAQGFHSCLLGSEARRVTLIAGDSARLAVGNLTFGEDSLPETSSYDGPIERPPDAFHFYNIDTGPDDGHVPQGPPLAAECEAILLFNQQ